LNFLLRPGWLDYNNLNVFGKSLFQPEYKILKKAFEEKLMKEAILRLVDSQNEIADLNVSPLNTVEEMAKNAPDKSDIECKFFENSSDVPDPRELSPDKKKAGAMSPKIFGDRNFAFGYVPEIRDRRGLDMSRKVIVPKTM